MDDMIEILRRLQTSQISDQEVSDIVFTIVKTLKETNIKLRPILEKNKAIFEKNFEQKLSTYSNL